MANEQSWHQKPLSQGAADKLHLGASSLFQEWKKPFCITRGDVVGASSSPDQAEKNKMVQNPPISSSVSCAATSDSTAKLDQTQAATFHSGVNYDSNLDPKKLKRIISNRLSAQRSRLKKTQYLANLEMQAKAYEVKIADLQPQLASYQNQKQFLMLEHQTLNNHMVALEKQKLLKDVEIENSIAERDMLRELHMKQEGQLIANRFNCDAGLQPISIGPISNYYTNPDQEFQVAQNGEDTPYMNVEIPLEQSQMPLVLDETLPMMPVMQTNLISKTAWIPNHIRHLP